MTVKIYDYWRSSASYRVRIALNLKNVSFEAAPINLHPDVNQQLAAEYKALNPQMRVPAIEVQGEVIGQSMAILEWIEETFPGPTLLPADPVSRLKARAFADTIACDVHPLNNPSVLNVLRSEFHASPDQIKAWYADWIRRGFSALEARYSQFETRYLFADYPTLAEICLVPQIYNARRFDVDLSDFPNLVEIDRRCQTQSAFQQASPDAVQSA